MKIPEEFKRLCSQFQMEILLYYDTPEGMIASGLKTVNQEDRKIIKTFLIDLLSENNAQKNEEAWRQTSASFYLSSDRGLVLFLEMVLDIIESGQK